METALYSTQQEKGSGIQTGVDLFPKEKPLTFESRIDSDEKRKATPKLPKNHKERVQELLPLIVKALGRAEAEAVEDRHLRFEHLEEAQIIWQECYKYRHGLRTNARRFLSLVFSYLCSPALLESDDAFPNFIAVLVEFSTCLDADEKDVNLWTERLESASLDPAWACTTPPTE